MTKQFLKQDKDMNFCSHSLTSIFCLRACDKYMGGNSGSPDKGHFLTTLHKDVLP